MNNNKYLQNCGKNKIMQRIKNSVTKFINFSWSKFLLTVIRFFSSILLVVYFIYHTFPFFLLLILYWMKISFIKRGKQFLIKVEKKLCFSISFFFPLSILFSENVFRYRKDICQCHIDGVFIVFVDSNLYAPSPSYRVQFSIV